MKKFKDFLYDFNDILVAVLIIAVAAVVILWRIDAIMAYPEYLEAKAAEQGQEIDFTDIDLTPDDIVDINDDPDEVDTYIDENQQEQTAPETQQGGEQTQEGENTPVAPAADTEIRIESGMSCKNVGETLAEKGLISDSKAFLARITELKADTKVCIGTFNIPAGTDLDGIIKIITKGR